MDRETRLDIIRRAYAKQTMAAAGIVDRRVEAAFASVKREDFLGPGPWPILRWGRGYEASPSRDPVYLYDDVLVGIIPERKLNNGQPWLHALLIASAAPKRGEHAVHIGAGVGYYTAILRHLVGRSGRVSAIEYDTELAARVVRNFSGAGNVRVVQGDGAAAAFDKAGVIYVNAGVTRPPDTWLDRLSDGGRLILPMTSSKGFADLGNEPIERTGAVFRIERRGGEFLARWISPVAIFPCEGARDAPSEAALDAAFGTGRVREVRQLYRRDDVPEADCWVRGSGWALAYR